MRRILIATDLYEMWETSPGRYSINAIGGSNIKSNLSFQEATIWWNRLTKLEEPVFSRSQLGESDLSLPRYTSSSRSERDRAMSEIRDLMGKRLRERL